MTSKLLPITQLADEIITVGDLVANQDLFTIEPGVPTPEAAEQMRRRDFRWAPVTAVPMTHYVALEDVETGSGVVSSVAQPIPPGRLLPGTARLTALIDHLLEDDVVFVTHRGFVFGILDEPDIQHAAMGLYTFGLVSALESGLDQLVVRYSDNRWEQMLSSNRLAKAKRIRSERLAADVDVGLQACLMLEDRLTLARKLDSIVEVLGFTSKSGGFDPWARQLKSVRNCLAHGNNVLDAISAVDEACRFLHDLRSKTTKVWQKVADDDHAAVLESRSVIEIQVGDDEWLEVGDPSRSVVEHDLPWPVHVISAHNPGRVRQGVAENRRAHEGLVASVAGRGLEFHPARAGFGDYWEDGVVLLDVSRRATCHLAAEFGQATIFEVTRDRVAVVDTQTAETLSLRATGLRGPEASSRQWHL